MITVDVPGQRLTVDYHAHLALDEGPKVMAFTPTYTFRKVSPGPHRVRVTIADPSHYPIPGMSRTLEFEGPNPH